MLFFYDALLFISEWCFSSWKCFGACFITCDESILLAMKHDPMNLPIFLYPFETFDFDKL